MVLSIRYIDDELAEIKVKLEGLYEVAKDSNPRKAVKIDIAILAIEQALKEGC